MRSFYLPQRHSLGLGFRLVNSPSHAASLRDASEGREFCLALPDVKEKIGLGPESQFGTVTDGRDRTINVG